MTTDPDRLLPEIHWRPVLITGAVLAVLAIVVWAVLPGPGFAYSVEQEGASSVLSITVRDSSIASASFRVEHPEGSAFVTVLDEEDSESVLRVWRVEGRVVTLRLTSPHGLKGTTTRLRYSGEGALVPLVSLVEKRP